MTLRWSLALVLVACGTTTNGNDAGPDGAAPDSGNDATFIDSPLGCGSFTTVSYDVDASVCAPQLVQTTSCQGAVCSFNVEVPCFGDAGPPDGGSLECVAWCNDAAPPTAPITNFCQTYAVDGGGLAARCGGCGI